MASRDKWDVEISAGQPLLDVDLASLWRYRDLVGMLVHRDFVALYKQTLLGPLWYVLQPLITTAIFTLVFSQIANIPTDNLPPFLFYLTGLVIWNCLATGVSKTSDIFAVNAGIFGKVYFPRLTVPVAVIITNMAAFAIQLLVVAGVLILFTLRGIPVKPTLWLFAIPFLVLYVAALALGTGMLLSSVVTRFRDLIFVVGFGMQLWMYATPVVYPLSQVPERWQWLITLNPMTPVVEIFRKAVLGNGTIHASHILTSVCVTSVVFFMGLLMFSRTHRNSIDTV